MRLIRPGTPAPHAKGERALRGKSPKETEAVETKPAREVWDDYGELKKRVVKKSMNGRTPPEPPCDQCGQL